MAGKIPDKLDRIFKIENKPTGQTHGTGNWCSLFEWGFFQKGRGDDERV